ncbi:MAG: hypothetical protein ACHREM_10880 [Polyangiales bacterium]
MKLLLDDRFAPTTTEYGFIECELSRVASWFRDWEQANQAKRGITVAMQLVEGNLEALLSRLQPLTSIQRRRHLFVAGRSGWTAYFDNGWRGTDAATLSHVARELACRAVRLVAVPDSMGTTVEQGALRRYGAVMFELYGPGRAAFLNYLRTINVANDGGKWRFEQSGEPLPFEELDAYTSRRLKDRFDQPRLERYLRALGIEAFNADAFGPQASLIESTGPMPPQLREYSLAEARHALC